VACALTLADVERVLESLRDQGADAIAARLDDELFGEGRKLAPARGSEGAP
jgi:hypothetical protein